MHGAAITLAQKYCAQHTDYDAIVASDMLDVALFRSLATRARQLPPMAAYFHENQLSYPWSPRDKDTQHGRDLHYAFINYTSALVADCVYFNSDYHRDAFLQALPILLDRYPDHENKETIGQIESKAKTLTLAMDLQSLDIHKPSERTVNARPTLLWNHRWEYDKNPIGFFKAIDALIDRRIDFDLVLLGERFEKEPPYFLKAKQRLGSRIVHYGHVESFASYAQWLWKADIAPVTSRQDFFGGSVVEAIHCACHPFLPDRLVYPNHLNAEQKEAYLYQNHEELVDKLATFIKSDRWKSPFIASQDIAGYDWAASIARYDEQMLQLSLINRD